MGGAFIKLGLWMQKVWCKFQCSWNYALMFITFKAVDSCPNKLCTCKK
jgi:hypothetical protein